MSYIPPLLIVPSILVEIFSIQPLVWQISHNNVASAFLISWIMLRNAFNIINASIWPSLESLLEGYDGVGLCDIEIKLKIALDVALFGCAAAILRNLANILDASSTSNLLSLSKKQRIIDQTVTWMLCAGFPFITAALHYLIQPSRYMLMAVSGCQYTIAYSWLSILIFELPRTLLAILGMYYAGQSCRLTFIYYYKTLTSLIALTLYRLRVYRLTITSILLSSPTASSTSTTSLRRFRRLLFLGLTTLAFLLPALIWSILNIVSPQSGRSGWNYLPPYSFASLHGPGWNEVEVNLLAVTHSVSVMRFSGILNAISPMIQVLFSAGYVVMGAVVIGLLGCGPDATRMYAVAWSWLLVHMKLRRAGHSGNAGDSRVTSGRGSADWRGATSPSSSVFASWRDGAGARVKRIWGSRSDGQLSRQSSNADVEMGIGQVSPGSTVSKLDVAHLKDGVEVGQQARGEGGDIA